jgi:monothiol glutaredoxin
MASEQSQETSPEEVEARVASLIEEHNRVLFIKGQPERPLCGFSQRAVGTLSRYDIDFEAVDVLSALSAYRDALESHSGWQTIPQLYVDGDFVGGSDIIVELDDRGDLEAALAVE